MSAPNGALLEGKRSLNILGFIYNSEGRSNHMRGGVEMDVRLREYLISYRFERGSGGATPKAGTIKSSNLCTEIVEYTSKDEVHISSF